MKKCLRHPVSVCQSDTSSSRFGFGWRPHIQIIAKAKKPCCRWSRNRNKRYLHNNECNNNVNNRSNTTFTTSTATITNSRGTRSITSKWPMQQEQQHVYQKLPQQWHYKYQHQEGRLIRATVVGTPKTIQALVSTIITNEKSPIAASTDITSPALLWCLNDNSVTTINGSKITAKAKLCSVATH